MKAIIPDRQKHDNFFKHCLSHKEEVVDFLKGRLPSALFNNLDLSTLVRKPEEFLPSRFRSRRRVDVLWTVQTKEKEEIALFFHFEAQATDDKYMAVRVLEYHTAIIRSFLQETKQDKCPPVITWVLYHGKKEWKSARSIAEILTNFNIYVNYGLKREFLIELRKENITTLKKDGKAGLIELILASQARDMLLEILEYILSRVMKKGTCCQEEVVNYILATHQEKTKEILEEISKSDKQTGKKLSDMFEYAKKEARQQGIQEGMQQGRQQGIQEGRQQGIQEGMQQGIQQGIREAINKIVAIGKLTQREAEKMILGA